MPTHAAKAGYAVAGIATGLFAFLWSVPFVFVSLIVMNGQRDGPLHGSHTSLVIHELALFMPFYIVGVGFWVWSFICFSRLRSSWIGVAFVTRTPHGWTARLPNITGMVLALLTIGGGIFLTALLPNVLFGMRNPVWFWACILPVWLLLTAWVYRRTRYRPTIRLDNATQSLYLPMGRRVPPLCVPWSAIVAITVVRTDGGDSADDFGCVLTYRVEEGEEQRCIATSTNEANSQEFTTWLNLRLAEARAMNL